MWCEFPVSNRFAGPGKDALYLNPNARFVGTVASCQALGWRSVQPYREYAQSRYLHVRNTRDCVVAQNAFEIYIHDREIIYV